MASERELITLISQLSRRAKSAAEAIQLIEEALTNEIGEATLLLDYAGGTSPRMAKFMSNFLDSREFPFRGFYTAPLNAKDRATGRLIAGFASHGTPGPALPKIAQHIASELGSLIARNHHAAVAEAA